jgi:hypothetical protein
VIPWNSVDRNPHWPAAGYLSLSYATVVFHASSFPAISTRSLLLRPRGGGSHESGHFEVKYNQDTAGSRPEIVCGIAPHAPTRARRSDDTEARHSSAAKRTDSDHAKPTHVGGPRTILVSPGPRRSLGRNEEQESGLCSCSVARGEVGLGLAPPRCRLRVLRHEHELRAILRHAGGVLRQGELMRLDP